VPIFIHHQQQLCASLERAHFYSPSAAALRFFRKVSFLFTISSSSFALLQKGLIFIHHQQH
jgi:hypothetical protein